MASMTRSSPNPRSGRGVNSSARSIMRDGRPSTRDPSNQHTCRNADGERGANGGKRMLLDAMSGIERAVFERVGRHRLEHARAMSRMRRIAQHNGHRVPERAGPLFTALVSDRCHHNALLFLGCHLRAVHAAAAARLPRRSSAGARRTSGRSRRTCPRARRLQSD